MKYIFILLLWVPFILLTDLFPFMRFGMFAEPVKTIQQTEFFILTITHQNKESEFDPKLSGIPTQTFNYLTRNYYYKNQISTLLKSIVKSNNISKNDKISIKKITIQISNNQKDTLNIYSIIKQ